MPMRAYRASRDAFSKSTSQAGAHVSGNKWLWMVLSAVVMVGAFLLNWATPGRATSYWGDLGAVAGLFLGTLIMMKSEEGNLPPVDDEDDDFPAAS